MLCQRIIRIRLFFWMKCRLFEKIIVYLHHDTTNNQLFAEYLIILFFIHLVVVCDLP